MDHPDLLRHHITEPDRRIALSTTAKELIDHARERITARIPAPPAADPQVVRSWAPVADRLFFGAAGREVAQQVRVAEWQTR